MDKKYNDIHVMYRNDEYIIRQVTEIYLRNQGGFIEINYRLPVDVNSPMRQIFEGRPCRIVVPCIEGVKIYID